MIIEFQILNSVIVHIIFGMEQVLNAELNCKQISMAQKLSCNLHWMVNLLESFLPQWK